MKGVTRKVKAKFKDHIVLEKISDSYFVLFTNFTIRFYRICKKLRGIEKVVDNLMKSMAEAREGTKVQNISDKKSLCCLATNQAACFNFSFLYS